MISLNEKQIPTLEKDKEVSQEEVSDIIFEGNMDKKTHSSYQTRFFQLKNGFLYWFKDQNSSIIQNKISLKNTVKIDSEKSKKFTKKIMNCGIYYSTYSFSTISPMYSKSSSFPCAFSAEV